MLPCNFNRHMHNCVLVYYSEIIESAARQQEKLDWPGRETGSGLIVECLFVRALLKSSIHTCSLARSEVNIANKALLPHVPCNLMERTSITYIKCIVRLIMCSCTPTLIIYSLSLVAIACLPCYLHTSCNYLLWWYCPLTFEGTCILSFSASQCTTTCSLNILSCNASFASHDHFKSKQSNSRRKFTICNWWNTLLLSHLVTLGCQPSLIQFSESSTISHLNTTVMWEGYKYPNFIERLLKV